MENKLRVEKFDDTKSFTIYKDGSNKSFASIKSKEDAERVVNTWNCHDELLGACKAALNAFTTNTDLFGVVDTLKSAIAKAEQK
jgi:hypothetical protein